MISTKEQILGAPKENTQSTVAEVAAPPVQAPVPNGGTAPTGNDGNAAPVNDGSAIVGAAKTVQGGVAPATTTPAITTTPPASTATTGNSPASTAPVGTETTKKAPLPTTQTAPAGNATATPGPTTEPAKAAEPKRMSYVEMFQQMSPYKPPTPEELEKERKREKREKVFAAIGDGIAALSNLYFTTKGAPNAFDPRNSLSEKARERWDKLNKEREENGRYYTQAYMQAMRNDEEADRENRNWQHQLEREKIGDDRYNADIEHRDKREGIEDNRYDANIKHRDAREKVEDERWKKNFDESVRQFNITSSQNAQRIRMESARLKKELQKDVVTFAIGRGKGTIAVPTNALNASNVSYIFSKLPANVQAQCRGEAIYDKNRRKIVGYKAPTTEAMLVSIGANIDGSVEAQDALREIAGGKPTGRKKLGLSGGKKVGLK